MHRRLTEVTATAALLLAAAGAAKASYQVYLNTSLAAAIDRGDLEAVCLFVRRGASVHTRARDGSTALHAAAWDPQPNVEEVVEAERPALIRTLVAAGAAVDARDRSGATPLIRAAGSTDFQTVHALVSAGADVYAADLRGWTVRKHATRNPQVEIIGYGCGPGGGSAITRSVKECILDLLTHSGTGR